MAAPTIRTVSPSTVLKNFPAGISSGKNRSRDDNIPGAVFIGFVIRLVFLFPSLAAEGAAAFPRLPFLPFLVGD